MFNFHSEIKKAQVNIIFRFLKRRFAWIFNVRTFLKIRYLRLTQISDQNFLINYFSRKMRWSTPNLATSILVCICDGAFLKISNYNWWCFQMSLSVYLGKIWENTFKQKFLHLERSGRMRKSSSLLKENTLYQLVRVCGLRVRFAATQWVLDDRKSSWAYSHRPQKLSSDQILFRWM